MTPKEKNLETARTILSGPFWRAEYFPKHYSESFTMEFPSAPPGMPNFFCTWEAERCFEWLNRTVMSWDVDLEALYSTPDPDQFWGVGIVGGMYTGGRARDISSPNFSQELSLRMARSIS